MKKFNGYTMKGITEEDNKILLNYQDEELFINELGQVWTSEIDGIYIADAKEFEEGDGIYC